MTGEFLGLIIMGTKYDDWCKLIVNLFSVISLPVYSGHWHVYNSSIKGNMIVYSSMRHSGNSQ